jgi:hypothetical protein
MKMKIFTFTVFFGAVNLLISLKCSLPDSGALPSVWDTRQSPDYTRQRALGKDFIGKDVFAECLLSGTRQRLCRVLKNTRQREALGKM